MTTFIRHGDVGLHKEDIDVSKLKKIGKDTWTLAEGEVTGHHHVITKKQGTLDIYDDGKGNWIVAVDGMATIVHPEHKTLEVPTGTYTMKIEREVDWFTKTRRQVLD